jgi:hypothetical protein
MRFPIRSLDDGCPDCGDTVRWSTDVEFSADGSRLRQVWWLCCMACCMEGPIRRRGEWLNHTEKEYA